MYEKYKYAGFERHSDLRATMFKKGWIAVQNIAYEGQSIEDGTRVYLTKSRRRTCSGKDNQVSARK